MKTMIRAFAGDILSFSLDRLLELASFPHRRISVGIDCLPLDTAEPSIFNAPSCTSLLPCCFGATFFQQETRLTREPGWN
jgi:hypothetical protein